ncbi:MAG: hypothetical protein KJZ86_08015 [Caldilineaceae bacterium]|nr:hypothetical protein [Caldilineaceae bacterium]HRJ40282.1 hypothetical protein [Caldilineaceae bacterium]
MSQVDILREIALSRAIDRQLDEIVHAAGDVAIQLQRNRGMRENQLRNVLDVALHTESVEVVGNYIRYQIGRGGAWKLNNFGECLITALGDNSSVDKAAQKAAAEAHKQMAIAQQAGKLGNEPLPEPNELVKEARRQLTGLFLGYLNRWFIYASKENAWDKITPLVKREGEATT